MADKEASRRKYLTLLAFDPSDGGACEVLVSFDRMQTVGRRSMAHAQECGHLVPATLQHPQAVFEGLCWDEDEDPRGYGWRCYCRIPDKAYRPDGTERSPYPGQVYLVFVNDERVAYNWRWEKADNDDADLPRDHQTRFKQRVL